MELKDICIDLEYAKKLKELGVKQDSFFWLKKYTDVGWDIAIDGCGYMPDKKDYSAFTSTELLEMLPVKIEYENYNYILEFHKQLDILTQKIVYKIIYATHKHYIPADIISEEKFCNALAKMLIYLIENKLISIV